jgi:hypothetical protein
MLASPSLGGPPLAAGPAAGEDGDGAVAAPSPGGSPATAQGGGGGGGGGGVGLTPAALASTALAAPIAGGASRPAAAAMLTPLPGSGSGGGSPGGGPGDARVDAYVTRKGARVPVGSLRTLPPEPAAALAIIDSALGGNPSFVKVRASCVEIAGRPAGSRARLARRARSSPAAGASALVPRRLPRPCPLQQGRNRCDRQPWLHRPRSTSHRAPLATQLPAARLPWLARLFCGQAPSPAATRPRAPTSSSPHPSCCLTARARCTRARPPARRAAPCSLQTHLSASSPSGSTWAS